MNAKALDLRTDSQVLRRLENAAQKKMSADELKEQRLSFVMGAMNSENSLTRDQVKRVIASHAVEE